LDFLLVINILNLILIPTYSYIGAAVATRDLLSDLRGAGEMTGGPPPLTRRDRSLFLQKLDETIRSIRRLHPASG